MSSLHSNLMVLLLMGAIAIPGCARSPEAQKARHLARGDQYFDKEKYREAILEYRNVLRFDAANEHVLQRLGIAYFHAGNLRESYPLLLKTKEISPENLDARLKLASLYLAGRRVNEAREEARFVLDKDQGNFEAVLLLAGSAGTAEEVQSAIKRLKSLAPRFGDQERFHLALAALYMRGKDLPAAEASFKQAVAQHPKSVKAHEALGNFYLMRREVKLAEQEFKTAAAVSEKQPGPGLVLANFYLVTGRAQEAKETLTALVAQHRDFLPALHRLAHIQLIEGKLAEAQETVKTILEKNPRDIEGRFLQGQIRVAEGKTTEGIADFQGVLKQEPGLPEVRFRLAQAYLQTGNVQQAKQELKKLSEYAPNYSRGSLALAELNLRSGAPDAAMDVVQPVVAKEPRNVQALRLLGMAHLAKKQAAQATEIFQKALELTPRDPQGVYLVGIGLRSQGKLDAAAQKFEEALAMKADYLDALVGLVQIAYAKKNPDAGLQRVTKQVQTVPSSPGIHHLLGTIYVTRKQNKAAEESFLKAIELEPKLLPAYMALGNVYARTNRYDEALAKAGEAARIHPKNPSVHMLIGILRQQKGNNELATKAYETVLEINPRFAPAANNLAYLYAEGGGDKEKALSLAQRAKELLPDDPNVADTLGWVLYKRGLYGSALNQLIDSAAKLPDNPVVQYHLGMTQFKLGNSKAAKQALSQALKLSSDFPGAKEAEQTLARIGNNDGRR